MVFWYSYLCQGGVGEEKGGVGDQGGGGCGGFHPLNIGRLAGGGGEVGFIPCTPHGVIFLLKGTLPTLEGLNAVVLGVPISLACRWGGGGVRGGAGVGVCHSRTKDLKEVIRQADVLVAAVGRPEMVKKDWVKPGAVVIDGGINRVEAPERGGGYKLVGDVGGDEVSGVAGAITPVPGGVGPMTIAMLLRNTLHSAKLAGK